jgi:abhydrolase domain-containing protein 13
MSDSAASAASSISANLTLNATAAEWTLRGAAEGLFSWIYSLAQTAVALVGLGGLIVYIFQEKLLYFPSMPQGARDTFEDPRKFLNAAQYTTDVRIPTPDGESLQAWFVHASSPEASKKRETVILFHGNAGNLSHRLPILQLLHAKCDVNVLIVSYRGYGLSTGKPSERGLQTDAQAALDFLLNREASAVAQRDIVGHSKGEEGDASASASSAMLTGTSPADQWQASPEAAAAERVVRAHVDTDKGAVLFGRSLGGAVVLHLASKPENAGLIRGVVAENTFTSIRDMMHSVLPFIPRIFRPLCTLGWHSLDVSVPSMAKLAVPVLFLSSDQDELVPPAMMRQLHETTVKESPHPERKHLIKFHEVQGGGHMDAFVYPSYQINLVMFLRELAAHHAERRAEG